MNPYIGEIRIFAGNFAPTGWALCNGQYLAIQSNPALFSVLGTFYGGDGVTSFALPDLRGRAPMHYDQGPGLSPYSIGETGGSESVILQTAEVPFHSHTLNASSSGGNVASPAGGVPALSPERNYGYSILAGANTQMAPIGSSVSLPHENRQPYLPLNFIIALQGVYPPRS